MGIDDENSLLGSRLIFSLKRFEIGIIIHGNFPDFYFNCTSVASEKKLIKNMFVTVILCK